MKILLLILFLPQGDGGTANLQTMEFETMAQCEAVGRAILNLPRAIRTRIDLTCIEVPEAGS